MTFTVEEEIMQVGLDRLASVLFPTTKESKRISSSANIGKRLSQLTDRMQVHSLSAEIDAGVPCVCWKICNEA